jgi:hypothetical protein
MPFWYIGSLVLTAGLAAATWGDAAAGAAIAAAALLAVSVVMSIALLVPINNRSATWTAGDHPDDWREQQQRRDRLHYLRVVIILAGFVLTLVAATAGQAAAQPGRPRPRAGAAVAPRAGCRCSTATDRIRSRRLRPGELIVSARTSNHDLTCWPRRR